MNYNNWQERHARAFEQRKRHPVGMHTPEKARERAWKNLTRSCTPEQLQRLRELVERYQTLNIEQR